MSKLRHLSHCLAHRFVPVSCPACHCGEARRIDAKYLGITTLLQCKQCFLRYRYPTDTVEKNNSFYQDSYTQKGLTTDLPGASELRHLLDTKFAGSEKDFSIYSGIIKEVARYLGRKLTILDYGANWGYACLQFDQYEEVENVYGLELSRPRRAFGETNLSIKYINEPVELSTSVDLLFSSHVIEHMSNPDNFKKCADIVLKPDGIILLTCPNGSDSARQAPDWSKLWSEVHPNFISDQYLCRLFNCYKGTISGDEVLSVKSSFDVLLQGRMASVLPTSANLFMIAQKT